MFIAHGERLRKYAPWILAGVLAVLLPSFVVLFSPSGTVHEKRGDLPTISGKPVNAAEFQHTRNTVIAQVALNTGRQPARSLEMEDQLNIEAIQRLVLMQKAREFGIRVSDTDVINQIRSQPIFLNEQHQYDPDRYVRYRAYLNNLGVSETQFEQIVREQVTLARLRELVTAAAKITPNELQLSYTPVHERIVIDYVEFDLADSKEPVEIKDEEARLAYEQNKAAFRKPAQVKVRYVYFTFSDAKQSLTLQDNEIAEYYERNKEKYAGTDKKARPLADVKDEVTKDLLTLRAERLAGDRATGFSVKLVYEPGAARPDFAKIAAGFNVTPQETEFFDLRGPVAGVGTIPQFNQAAFALSPDAPFSDPAHGDDGYYVLEYLAGKPSQIPPFDEVKAQVIDRLKRLHAHEAVVKQGRELAGKVKEAVAAGKSFAEACAALGIKVKISAPFTLAEETTDLPAANTVKEVALGLPVHGVSEFIPSANGGLFFHLKERTPPNPEDFEKNKPQLEAQLLERNRQSLFRDWVGALMRDERVEYKRRTSPSRPQSPLEEPEPVEQTASPQS